MPSRKKCVSSKKPSYFIYVQNTMKKSLFWVLLLAVVVFSFFIMQNPTSQLAIGVKTALGIPTQDLTPETVFSGYSDSGMIVDQDTFDTGNSTTPAKTHPSKSTSWHNQEAPTICTMDYTPVCASIQVQCIKAPCPPIKQTFGNTCMMNANKLAKFLYTGECKEDAPTGIANPASVNCEKVWGKLTIKEGTGGQYGECTLPSGKVCEERALFRGECGK